MLSLYVPGTSPVHRAGPGPKLTALFALGVAAAVISSIAGLAVLLAAVCLLYGVARLPVVQIAGALKPFILFAAIIFAAQWIFAGLPDAVRVLLRITVLVLAASLVTFTTPLSAMVRTLQRAAQPLAFTGLPPAHTALAVALTLRFIPVLMNDFREIEAARASRCAKRPALGAAGPLLIKTLHMTGTLSEAIAARGFESRSHKDTGP